MRSISTVVVFGQFGLLSVSIGGWESKWGCVGGLFALVVVLTCAIPCESVGWVQYTYPSPAVPCTGLVYVYGIVICAGVLICDPVVVDKIE